jgi:cyclase
MTAKIGISIVLLFCASVSFVVAQEFIETKVGENILVITARFSWWEVNMAAIRTDEGLIVVDTLYRPDACGEAFKLIEEFSDKPVRYVINTHYHPDHVFGNGGFEGALIIGHENCPAGMEAEVPRQVQGAKRMIPQMEEQLTALEAQNPEQAAVLKDRLEWLKAMVSLIEEGGFEPTPPALTIEKGAQLSLGGKKINLLYLGPFHTDSDIVVFIPEDRVVFLGDLYHRNNLPYVNTALVGNPENLIAVYDKLIALGNQADYYVPGHGPVADVNFLEKHRNYLTALVDAVKTAKENGLSLEQAKAEILLEKYREFGNFEQIHAANIENCWECY